MKHSGATGFDVEIARSAGGEGVEIAFSDDGAPYDPLAHEDPDTSLPAEARPIGGLGIMMVRKMADSVRYERVNGRNRLVVSKNAQATDGTAGRG